MFNSYKPTWMIEAIYQLTPEQLKKQQIKAILTDLDNTLIAWNNPDGTKELLEWMETMHQANIPVVVVSNNNEKRVQRAVQHLSLDFVSGAFKPFTKGMNEATNRLGIPKQHLVMVGDQLMTDIKASNSAGIRSILVQPIVNTDSWKTKFNRTVEKFVMRHLKKKYSDMEWRSELT